MSGAKEVIPWEKSTVTGYGSLDMTLTLGSNVGTIAVRRRREDGGKFAVYHNDTRVSDELHERRLEALAEGERYLYSLPQFAKSNTGAIVMAQVEEGRQGFRDGKAIDQNPFNQTAAHARAQWFTGWLEAYGAGAAAKAINAAVATARANEQLSADLNMALARNTVYKLAIQYATDDKHMSVENAWIFLKTFLENDSDAIIKSYPDWPSYVSEKTGAAITVLEPTRQ